LVRVGQVYQGEGYYSVFIKGFGGTLVKDLLGKKFQIGLKRFPRFG